MISSIVVPYSILKTAHRQSLLPQGLYQKGTQDFSFAAFVLLGQLYQEEFIEGHRWLFFV
jgi:hypothetical protein